MPVKRFLYFGIKRCAAFIIDNLDVTLGGLGDCVGIFRRAINHIVNEL